MFDNTNLGGQKRARAVRWVGRAVGALASVLLCVMVIITCIDVVGRYFFAAPLLGAHELITLAMGMMIYLSLPLVTAAREHLTVDLAGKFLGPSGKCIQLVVVNTVAALTFVLFSYLLWLHGIGLADDLMTTEDFEIEQAPLAFLMAVMCFFTIIVFLYHVVRDILNKEADYTKPKPEPQMRDGSDL